MSPVETRFFLVVCHQKNYGVVNVLILEIKKREIIIFKKLNSNKNFKKFTKNIGMHLNRNEICYLEDKKDIKLKLPIVS